jgi:hypothetical protein
MEIGGCSAALVVKALSSRIDECQPIGIIDLLKDQIEGMQGDGTAGYPRSGSDVRCGSGGC